MRPFLAFLILATALRADPLAGARESFASEANADAWNLYTYSDGMFTAPPWVGPPVDENPYAYSLFKGGKGVWFFADEFTAQGAFVGNYAAQKISGVDLSLNIDPAEIDFIDLVVYADGPAGPGYYFSVIYAPEDLGELPDWYDLRFRFDENWFSIVSGVASPFLPDETFLASIEEVGVRVFPLAGVAEDSYVGMDDFILVPTVEAPTPAASVSGASFVLQFALNPGVEATIEKLDPDLIWRGIAGQSGLTGSKTFTTPLAAGAGIFRLAAREKLTLVTSP
ncbi:hypothetical protein HZ994_01360 [Akkermansiaceae bacterium]|nr:hypothetical protein HZ994_01360 [Akkermansiaceae bacterium]